MAFASPSASSRKIISISDAATSGVVNNLFTIPQDADSIFVKFWTASNFAISGSGNAKVYIQTSEDGGTTWRDVVAWTVATPIVNDLAHFQPIPCVADSLRGLSGWIGSVQSSTLAPAASAGAALGNVNGLGMLGTLGRVSIQYTATVTTGGVNVDIFAPTTQLR